MLYDDLLMIILFLCSSADRGEFVGLLHCIVWFSEWEISGEVKV